MSFFGLLFACFFLGTPILMQVQEPVFGLPSGAEGDGFEIHAKLDPVEVLLGEKANLRIQVKPLGKYHSGPLRLELDQVPGWDRTLEVGLVADGFSWSETTKTWEADYALTAKVPGVYFMPEIPLVYVNPAIAYPSRKKMVVFSQSNRLIVREPDEIQIATPLSPGKLPADLPVKPVAAWLEKALTGLLFTLAAWLGLRMVRKHLKENAAYLDAGRGGWFLDRLKNEPFGKADAQGWMKILQEYFQNTFGFPNGVVTSREIREGLFVKSLDQDEALRLAEFVEQTEKDSFAPAKAFEEASWRTQARQWVGVLESRR